MPINNNMDDALDYTENPGAIWDTGVREDFPLDKANYSEDTRAAGSDITHSGPDDQSQIGDLSGMFGELISSIARIKAVSSSDRTRVNRDIAMHVERGAIEVLIAHPEFIPLINWDNDVNRQIGLSNETPTGEQVAPYIKYTERMNSGTSETPENAPLRELADILNLALNTNSTADSLSGTSTASAMIDKLGYKFYPDDSDNAGKLNTLGNPYLEMVDRLRAGIISAAMHNSKLPGNDVSENNSYAVSRFGSAMDMIQKTISKEYPDTPEHIAEVLRLDPSMVKDVLSTDGTAFGVPKSDAEHYSYASMLIPWLYYLIGEYSGNTNADESVRDMFNKTGTKNASAVAANMAGMASGSVFHFGDAADMFVGQLKDILPDARNFAIDFARRLSQANPAINVGDDGSITVNGTPLSTSALIGYLVMNSGASALRAPIADICDGNDAYQNVRKTFMDIKQNLLGVIGTKGNSVKWKGYKQIPAAIIKQIDELGGSNVAAANLKSTINGDITGKADSNGLGGISNMFADPKAKGDLHVGIKCAVLFGKLLDDPDLVAGMHAASGTAAPAQSDDDADDATANNNDDLQQYNTEFVDPLSTATEYANRGIERALSVTSERGEDVYSNRKFIEIPFDATGSRYGSLVAPERIIPLFATSIPKLDGADAAETAVFGELVPRLLHYILAHSTVNPGIEYKTMYSADGETPSTGDIIRAIDTMITEAGKDAATAIKLRNDAAGTINQIMNDMPPAVSDMVSGALQRINPEEAGSPGAIRKVANTLLRHIASAVFYMKNVGRRDIVINNNEMVPDGVLRHVNVFNGINRQDSGRILRKTGNGDGHITDAGAKISFVSGAKVTDETNDYIEVSFSGDPAVKIASKDQATNYIKPTPVAFATKGVTYYCLWNGIVTYSDHISGYPENTLHTDPRVRDYHARELERYAGEHADTIRAGAAKMRAEFDNKLAEFMRSYNGDEESIKAFASGIGKVGGNTLGQMAKSAFPIVNQLTNKRNKLPASVREAILPTLTLVGMLDGSLKNTLSQAASDNPESADQLNNVIRMLDRLMVTPAAKNISGLLASDPIMGELGNSITADKIKRFIELALVWRATDAFNSRNENGVSVRGDQSITERVAKPYFDSPVVSLDGDEDDNEDMVAMRNGLHTEMTSGGELSMYADENGLDRIHGNAPDYSSVFGDAYPVIGLIKRGPGFGSNGELADADTLCGTGLNVHDMSTLLAAIDSSKAEVEEVIAPYRGRQTGMAMTMLIGTHFISYLIAQFYDLFTMRGRGINAKIEEVASRISTLVTLDGIDPTLYSYAIPCVDALNRIAEHAHGGMGDKSLSDAMTGIANIVIYLESVNPANTVQNGALQDSDLTNTELPSGARDYAMSIGSAYRENKTVTQQVADNRMLYKMQNMELYGANTKFGKFAANMYYNLDRGETEGYDNQYDQFDYMISHLCEKAIGSDVSTHGNIASTDLMAEILSAIIDDEGAPDDETGSYTRVARLIEALAKGEPVESLYLLHANPRKIPNSNSIDTTSTVTVRFATNGRATESEDTGTRFTTVGELANAASGKRSGNNSNTGVMVSNPSRELLDESGSANQDAVNDIVKAVRVAITNRLLSEMAESNVVSDRMKNAFKDGAMGLKTNPGKFVSIALIILLLYTRSIDKARYAEVSGAADRMTDRMNAAQVDRMNRRVAEIDPTLANIVNDQRNDINSPAAVQAAIEVLTRYGEAFLGDAGEDEADNIAESTDAVDAFGGYAKDFLAGFGNMLRRNRVQNVTDEAERAEKIRTNAMRYMGTALRSNPAISDNLTSTSNMTSSRSLAAALYKYGMSVGPAVTSLPEYSDETGDAKSARDSIRNIMHNDGVADQVISGYLKVAKRAGSSDQLRNITDRFVGQLLNTDPVFRSAVMPKHTSRDDLVLTQGVTPLDSTALPTRSIGEVVPRLAAYPDRSAADSKRLGDLGVSERGVDMVDGVYRKIDRLIDEIADSKEQYVPARLWIDSHPDDTKSRMHMKYSTAIENYKGTFTKILVEIRESIAALFDPKDDAYTGVSSGSLIATSLKQYMDDTVPEQIGNIFRDCMVDGKVPAESRGMIRSAIEECKKTVHTKIATAYASGRTIYRDGLFDKIGSMRKNTTMSEQKLSNEECIDILKLIEKADHSVSTHASIPGSNEDMYAIYGSYRTEDEAVALVNAAVAEYLADHPDASIDDLDAHDALEISGYLRSHYGMTTGTAVTAENIAPYVMALMLKAKCLRNNGGRYVRYVRKNGDMYECTVPMKYIARLIDANMPEGMDSNEWAAAVKTFNTRTVSGNAGVYGSSGDSAMDKLVNAARSCLDNIVRKCNNAAADAANASDHAVTTADGIQARITNADSPESSSRLDISTTA